METKDLLTEAFKLLEASFEKVLASTMKTGPDGFKDPEVRTRMINLYRDLESYFEFELEDN